MRTVRDEGRRRRSFITRDDIWDVHPVLSAFRVFEKSRRDGIGAAREAVYDFDTIVEFS